MLDQNLIRDLKEFGFNEYEARSYLALTIYGPSTASSISNYSGVPQSKVYEVMRSLQKKSLIESWFSKPQKYKAIKLSETLKKIIKRKRENIQSLIIKGNNIIKNIKPYSPKSNSEIWVLKGKDAFFEKTIETLKRIKNNIFFVTTSFPRRPELDFAFTNAIKKGVKVRILGTSQLDSSNKAKANWYIKRGAKIKIFPLEIKPTLSIYDEKEICIKINNISNVDFIWSNNIALVNIIKYYFNALWKAATPLGLMKYN